MTTSACDGSSAVRPAHPLVPLTTVHRRAINRGDNMARAGQVRRESVETEMYKSEDKTFVYTKKKGYDVARNPSLNKVSVEAKL